MLDDIGEVDKVTDEKQTSKSQDVVKMKLVSGLEKVEKYKKFSFGKEEKLPISKLVLTIVKEIAEDNNNWEKLVSFMKQVSEKKGKKFPAWTTQEKANQIYENTKYRRHFLNEEDIIGDYYAVTTQWNREELKHFLELLEDQYGGIWEKVTLAK